ncbi:MAG TPA: alpha/beta fold hydrolase [Planctomycetaceae bacterium]|nr:alpha/beta fold hydrolase [Planctomycetaceae bacterium]
MGWVILGVCAGVLLADLLVRALAVSAILPVFERRPPFAVEPAEPDPDVEPVAFATSHGLTLRGSLSRSLDRPSRGIVIFCPEMAGCHWQAPSYCQGLRRAGFDVLAFDFRNQGQSDSLAGYEPLHWVTEYEVADVRAAIEYVRSRDDLGGLPLGLFGISRGGGAALAAAARNGEVEAVACEGAFTTDALTLVYLYRWAELYVPNQIMRLIPHWHISGTLALARRVSQWRRACRYTVLECELLKLRDRAVLFIAGGRDTYVPPAVSEAMCRRIGGRRQRVWLVEEARHNLARRVDPDEYDRRLAAFFHEALSAACVPEPHVVRRVTPGVLGDPVA